MLLPVALMIAHCRIFRAHLFQLQISYCSVGMLCDQTSTAVMHVCATAIIERDHTPVVLLAVACALQLGLAAGGLYDLCRHLTCPDMAMSLVASIYLPS